MPNFDKTGPAGKGAKTGGQMGSCAGTIVQERPFDGRGQGVGRGRGRRRSARGFRSLFGRRGRSVEIEEKKD